LQFLMTAGQVGDHIGRRFVKAGGPGRASSMVGTPRRIAADSIRARSQLRRQTTRPKTVSRQVPNTDSHHFWQLFHAGFGVSGWPNTPHGAGNEARWRGAKGVQHYQVMWWRRSQSGVIPSLQNSLQTEKITGYFRCFCQSNADLGENPHEYSMSYWEFPC